jgi:hypothetical protein
MSALLSRLGVIRDRVEPAASPLLSDMPRMQTQLQPATSPAQIAASGLRRKSLSLETARRHFGWNSLIPPGHPASTEEIAMRSPWAMSQIEAFIFVGLVLLGAGAGTFMTLASQAG